MNKVFFPFLPKILKTKQLSLLTNQANTAILQYDCRGVLVITTENFIQQSLKFDFAWVQILIAACQKVCYSADLQHWSNTKMRLN